MPLSIQDRPKQPHPHPPTPPFKAQSRMAHKDSIRPHQGGLELRLFTPGIQLVEQPGQPSMRGAASIDHLTSPLEVVNTPLS